MAVSTHLKMAKHRADGDPHSPGSRAKERLLREYAYLSRFMHPNIVRVHGCGRWPEDGNGWVYLVPSPRRAEVTPEARAFHTSVWPLRGHRGITAWVMGACLAFGAAVGVMVTRLSQAPQSEERLDRIMTHGDIVASVVQGVLGDTIVGPVSPQQMRPPCRSPFVEIKSSCWREMAFPDSDISPGALKRFCDQALWVISIDDCMKNKRSFLPPKEGATPSAVQPKGK